jgi:hypothetical protein
MVKTYTVQIIAVNEEITDIVVKSDTPWDIVQCEDIKTLLSKRYIRICADHPIGRNTQTLIIHKVSNGAY